MLQIFTPTNWTDYELLDSGNGEKLERFGLYTLVRPDPQLIWQRQLPHEAWNKADAIFKRSTADKGNWQKRTAIPEKWLMHYGELSFWAKLTPFKHTGIFPEQSVNWDWMERQVKSAKFKIQSETRDMHVLNLFAYTGIASLVCAAAGAKVTHVDASKSAITWARENQGASKLEDKPIRWILDDVLKFVSREIRRGVKYDGIIMDPPIFGHGTEGETWKFQEHVPQLLNLCRQVLSEEPLFVLINAYAISASSLMLQNLLEDMMADYNGTITAGELALEQTNSHRLLSTGIVGRWEANNSSI